MGAGWRLEPPPCRLVLAGRVSYNGATARFSENPRKDGFVVTRRQWICLVSWALGLLAGVVPAWADVAVLNNRSGQPVRVTTVPGDGPGESQELASGETRSYFFSEQLLVRVQQGSIKQQHRLVAGQAYLLADLPDANRIAFRQLPLGRSPAPLRLPGAASSNHEPATLKVKLLLDEDEPTRRSHWEPRLRQRLELASDVFLQHAGIRLEIVAIERWNSDDRTRDFSQTLKEFEQEVDPAPAQVAIGFSSQYRVERGRFHLGGTRGTLHSHILIKERAPNVQEPERCELLVHELGHLLGATHSGQPDSVMRPVLKGGLQRRAGATIKFDPANALLMAMLGDEMRRRPVSSLEDLSSATRRRMSEIYAALLPKLPNDPATANYQKLLARASVGGLARDVKTISNRILQVARQQSTAAAAVDGDQLLELYVREAAKTARQLNSENSPRALVLALGLAVDDTGVLRRMAATRKIVRFLDSDQQLLRRLQLIGNPTMRGRNDLARHFLISAHLTAAVGSQAARGVGVAKELFDTQGSGFSFADMAANRAGIQFATAVITRRVSLDAIADQFSVEAYLPQLEELGEGLNSSQFSRQFGGVTDPRYRRQIEQIEAAILALPAYQTAD